MLLGLALLKDRRIHPAIHVCEQSKNLVSHRLRVFARVKHSVQVQPTPAQIPAQRQQSVTYLAVSRRDGAENEVARRTGSSREVKLPASSAKTYWSAIAPAS
jgi:hypothetical protein